MVADDYQFWLFDLDGTLVDVEFDYARQVTTAVGDRLGASFDDREVHALWYGRSDRRERVLDRAGIDPERFWTVFHEVEDAPTRAGATYVYDDAALVAGIDAPVGLVTHCQRYLTEPVLEHCGIGEWFDAVLCCTDETGWKPDPAPLYHVMGGLGVGLPGGDRDPDPGGPGETPARGASGDGTGEARAATDGGPGRAAGDGPAPGVYVGDSPSDVGAAANAGLDAVYLVRDDDDPAEPPVPADYRVGSLAELEL